MSKELNREVNRYEKEILVEKYKTALKKTQYINEIKTGLGNEIKKNPSQVKIIKKSLGQKIKLFFLSLFTKF